MRCLSQYHLFKIGLIRNTHSFIIQTIRNLISHLLLINSYPIQPVSYTNQMNLKRLKPIDQTSDYMEDLCKKNQTSVSSCGYITLAIIEYFSMLQKFNGEPDILAINQHNMTPYIEKVMNHLKKSRKNQLKKFWNQMIDNQRKNYLKDWVANFQIADYLQNVSQNMLNQQVIFFRQSAYDQPEAVQNVKFQQAERVKEEIEFKGEQLFYTKFFPQMMNVKKENFIEEITKFDLSKPVIIATDVAGHYNVTILFDSVVYVVDSLPTKATNFDQYIVEYIQTSYKRAIEKIAQQI